MTTAATLAVSREFFRGYELCRGNGLPAENGKSNAIIPSVVCLAFSIELGLKAILLSTSGSTSGHKLAALFNRLTSEDKAAVVRAAGVEPRSFAEELGAVSNAFVEWRYLHEQPGLHSINIPFLLQVRLGVNVVGEQKNELHRRQLRAVKK